MDFPLLPSFLNFLNSLFFLSQFLVHCAGRSVSGLEFSDALDGLSHCLSDPPWPHTVSHLETCGGCSWSWQTLFRFVHIGPQQSHPLRRHSRWFCPSSCGDSDPVDACPGLFLDGSCPWSLNCCLFPEIFVLLHFARLGIFVCLLWVPSPYYFYSGLESPSWRTPFSALVSFFFSELWWGWVFCFSPSVLPPQWLSSY